MDENQSHLNVDFNRILELKLTMGLNDAVRTAYREAALEALNNAKTVDDLKPIMLYLLNKL